MNWKRYTMILVLPLVIISLPSTLCAAQAKIQGDYCYQYGDSESLMVAKEISYAMALRKAIETYKTFVASTSVVQDFKLRKDLVETIASGYVDNIKVTKQTVEGRKVCTELTGDVNSDAVKSIIARKVEKIHKIKKREFQGLLSNDKIKILNYKKARCKSPYGRSQCVYIIYQAKKYLQPIDVSIILDCYDKEGNQISGKKSRVPVAEHLFKDEVREEQIMVDGNVVSFELRLR